MEPPTKQRKIDCPKIGLLDLPNEILEVILKYLKIDVIHLKAALVCKRFLEVTRLPTFCETFRVGFEYEQNRSKNEQIEDSCLKKIKQILKLYPDCQLEFYHYGGNSKDFFKFIENLQKFAQCITKLELMFYSDRLNYFDFEKIIYLENLKCLVLDFSNHCEEVGFSISHFGGRLWRNFPNLISLTIEDCSRETVSTTRKID